MECVASYDLRGRHGSVLMTSLHSVLGRWLQRHLLASCEDLGADPGACGTGCRDRPNDEGTRGVGPTRRLRARFLRPNQTPGLLSPGSLNVNEHGHPGEEAPWRRTGQVLGDAARELDTHASRSGTVEDYTYLQTGTSPSWAVLVHDESREGALRPVDSVYVELMRGAFTVLVAGFRSMPDGPGSGVVLQKHTALRPLTGFELQGAELVDGEQLGHSAPEAAPLVATEGPSCRQGQRRLC